MTQQERIEKAAETYASSKLTYHEYIIHGDIAKIDFIAGANWALSHQWISVDEELPPKEGIILARLSENFYGTKSIEVLHYYQCNRFTLTHPKGYYDAFGEQIPTEVITHWMPIPTLEGGEE